MKILKFGGSSVANSECINKVHAILQKIDEPFLVVVSAFSGTTDALIEISELALNSAHLKSFSALKKHHLQICEDLLKEEKEYQITCNFIEETFSKIQEVCYGISMLKELSERTSAKILSNGEMISSYVICQFMNSKGIEIELLDSRDYISVYNDQILKAAVDREETYASISSLDTHKNYIAPGFIAYNKNKETALLGRGGSDYTAAIFAAGLKAETVQIWSDVNGMMSANPRVVKDAKTITELSYKEAFELSHFGAKVLYPPTIRPLMDKNIPVYLKNTFEPENEGTFIGHSLEASEDFIKGVSSLKGISIITVSGVGMAGIKGTASKVFNALETADVNVVLITQCCSEQSICIGVETKDEKTALIALNQKFAYDIDDNRIDPIEVESDFSVIAVVGDRMKKKVGLSGKVFSALGKNGINITAIAQGASERNISVVIHKKDEAKALNLIHESFFSKSIKNIHLYITGVGNVGSEFLKILESQLPEIQAYQKINIKIVGICNSKKMLVDPNGIDSFNKNELVSTGQEYNHFGEFVSLMKSYNLPNSIFIDNTASSVVSKHYLSILDLSISIIACNKIACSDTFLNYSKLKNRASEKNCSFNYETTVGAALPVIKTIQNLVQSGDKVHKIQAVLSGSLNFIFNNYNAQSTFSKIVKRAKTEGYTEPDPLIDLSGVDVKRKILILAREAGFDIEMDQISSIHFLPTNCLNANSVDTLFDEMEKEEEHFKDLFENANKQGKKLKFVATFDQGKAYVGLEEISADSPFYHLEGKDNIVSINSRRYPSEPLVIKGAGAGAELTASGVFSDLMMIINN